MYYAEKIKSQKISVASWGGCEHQNHVTAIYFGEESYIQKKNNLIFIVTEIKFI